MRDEDFAQSKGTNKAPCYQAVSAACYIGPCNSNHKAVVTVGEERNKREEIIHREVLFRLESEKPILFPSYGKGNVLIKRMKGGCTCSGDVMRVAWGENKTSLSATLDWHIKIGLGLYLALPLLIPCRCQALCPPATVKLMEVVVLTFQLLCFLVLWPCMWELTMSMSGTIYTDTGQTDTWRPFPWRKRIPYYFCSSSLNKIKCNMLTGSGWSTHKDLRWVLTGAMNEAHSLKSKSSGINCLNCTVCWVWGFSWFRVVFYCWWTQVPVRHFLFIFFLFIFSFLFLFSTCSSIKSSFDHVS